MDAQGGDGMSGLASGSVPPPCRADAGALAGLMCLAASAAAFASSTAEQGEEEDYLAMLRTAEVRFLPDPNYLAAVQAAVGPGAIVEWMRKKLVVWMFDASRELHLATETFSLAVNYVDRMLSRRAMSYRDLQLLGCACLFVAAKVREHSDPYMMDYTDIAAGAFTRGNLADMEVTLLTSLQWSLQAVTPRLPHLRAARAAGRGPPHRQRQRRSCSRWRRRATTCSRTGRRCWPRRRRGQPAAVRGGQAAVHARRLRGHGVRPEDDALQCVCAALQALHQEVTAPDRTMMMMGTTTTMVVATPAAAATAAMAARRPAPSNRSAVPTSESRGCGG